MPLDETIKNDVNAYVLAHLPKDDYYDEYFDYINDLTLKERLSQEFKSIRYIYKLFEGLYVNDWLLKSQVKIQVLYYASIYEAILHYMLFDRLLNHPLVNDLLTTKRYHRYSIPSESAHALSSILQHDGKDIIPMFEKLEPIDITKIRFENKVDTCKEVGMLSVGLAKDIIEIYNARNSIHIHSEIRRSQEYQLELSLRSYRRMKPLREQIVRYIEKFGI